MKKISTIMVFLIIVILCAGCNSDGQLSTESKQDGMTLSIYSLDRDIFQHFLNDANVNVFSNENVQTYVYVSESIQHIRQGSTLFSLDKALFEFLNDYDNIEELFYTNNLSVNVQDAILFETPNTPVTIWTQTDDANYFITINENIEDTQYEYKLYTLQTYKDKYGAKNATLIVNGESVTSNAPITMYDSYADVPLCDVVKCFGTVTQQDDGLLKFLINDANYFLDVNNSILYEENNPNINLLHCVYGGVSFIGNNDSHFMVDTNVVKGVLHSMGINVYINFNKDHGQILINTSDYGQ